MKKITWGKLIILKVSGVSLGQVAKIIALYMRVGGEKIKRLYETNDGGVLVQLRDTDDDAEIAYKRLLDEFGQDRVAEV